MPPNKDFDASINTTQPDGSLSAACCVEEEIFRAEPALSVVLLVSGRRKCSKFVFFFFTQLAKRLCLPSGWRLKWRQKVCQDSESTTTTTASLLFIVAMLVFFDPRHPVFFLPGMTRKGGAQVTRRWTTLSVTIHFDL